MTVTKLISDAKAIINRVCHIIKWTSDAARERVREWQQCQGLEVDKNRDFPQLWEYKLLSPNLNW